MRYRLTILSVIVAVLVAAAVFVTLSNEEAPSNEPEQTPTALLGIVAAFTATARAGGAALDPTALASPTAVGGPAAVTAGIPVETAVPERRPQLTTSSSRISPGESLSLELTGAGAGEQFEILIGGTAISGLNSADAAGSAQITVTVPGGLQAGTAEIAFSGGQSGTTSISIEIVLLAPRVTISPDSPVSGSAVTVSAEGLGAAEMITVRISGNSIGSAVTDDVGSFSITTRLPELEQGAHSVSLEGRGGQLAAAEVNIGSGQAVAALTATATVEASPNSGSGVPLAGGTPGGSAEGQDTGGPAVAAQAAPELPSWLYIVIGVFAGWLGLLTVWVIRLDRSRERRSEALLRKMASLVISGRSQGRLARSAGADDRNRSDAPDRAA